jgi:triacylglycerol lipase
MKKLFLVLFLLVTIPVTAMAGGNPDTCNTKYPVILAHGMAASAEILGIVDYWWGIDNALADEGCSVYKTSVNGMDSTQAKAEHFKSQFLQILAVTGASKANIIGHSHGTIYTREAISNLGLAPKVVSHTSIAGPHRGSALANLIMYSFSDDVIDLFGGSLDFVYAYIMGDTNPDSIANGYALCTDYMQNTFNPNTPNMPGIRYQSWAAKAKTSCPSVILEIPWLIMLAEEGANDGLVSVTSAKWGNFRGVEDAAWYSAGVDHLNIVGQLFGVTPGFDENEFYVDIVSELKGWGY